MPIDPSALLTFEPEDDGWLVARTGGTGRFVDLFRTIRIRAEGEDRARVRFDTGPLARNITDSVHGGYLLAVVDQSLFMACRVWESEAGLRGVTVEAGCHFLAPLSVEAPVDAVVERLRETRRLIFLRGLVEQAGVVGASFSGTIRKAST